MVVEPISVSHPEALFIFVGAGASMPPPANLPLFNWIRDEILDQLGLHAFRPGNADSDLGRVAVARALAPEPFLSSLVSGGLPVEAWLGQVLEGRPNAVHHALADIAHRGARVWTVNFDRLIETADPRLDVLAWPEEPVRPAQLMKPHGSLPGPLILRSDQVVAGLSEPWRRRLEADVDGRTAIFLGYSGRDLDFQPLWDEILRRAACVLWFSQREHDTGRPEDESMKRSLLRSTDARGALSFPSPEPPPAGIGLHPPSNSSWDFVAWCERHGLIKLKPGPAAALFDEVAVSFPPLPQPIAFAKAHLLDNLGDFEAARRVRLTVLGRGRHRRRAAAELFGSLVTHGERNVALALALGQALPQFGVAARWSEIARRKRLTALHRAARHEQVLAATRRLPPDVLSTYLILRAASTRWLGSLDEAAKLSIEALRRARGEQHPVRAAHAAFQLVYALLWADRTAEARRHLDDDLQPVAAIAANRWVAWAEFLEGCLAVRDADAEAALTRFAASERLFRAEALLDGAVSVGVARLAALRLAGDDVGFRRQVADLEPSSFPTAAGRYYARTSPIGPELLAIQRTEFVRLHEQRPRKTVEIARNLTGSRFPLHRALGHLEIALACDQPGPREDARRAAERIAATIGARHIRERAAYLANDPRAKAEFFFC